jgi:hypothetical protein|tara:strand:+ start:533 stop:1018 length:486 start_codon:yes stop_codon:yes gene_type:complete
MDIQTGFKIDDPDLFLPYDSGLDDVVLLLDGHDPTRVTEGYLTLPSTALDGLKMQVGLHFRPDNSSGLLKVFELFFGKEELQHHFGRISYGDLQESYDLFQAHLEKTLGEPHKTEQGEYRNSMPTNYWNFGEVEVIHKVFERFGPEEHVRFRKGHEPDFYF